MKSVIISKNELEYHSRIDADFYKKQYMAIINDLKKIKKNKVVSLREITTSDVSTGSTPPQADRVPLNDGTDVLFIKTEPVRKGYIEYDRVDLLPLIEHNRRKLTSVKYGDVVVTVVGATHEIVGRAAVYLLNSPANINQSDVVLKINTKLALPGFVSTFLNSKYGRSQIWKYSGQTEQVTLNGREMEQVLIPLLAMDIQKDIHDAVLKSDELRIKSKKLYDAATKILMDKIKLSETNKVKKTCFFINSEFVKNAKKIEPEYFDPSIKLLIDHVKKNASSFGIIGDMFEWTKGKDVGSELYTDSKYGFVRVSDISKFGIDEPSKKIGKALFNKLKKYRLKLGDILFTKDGTVGISYVVKEEYLGITSGAFLTLKLKKKYTDIDPEYIAFVLNSSIIKIQADKFTGPATIIKHLCPQDFGKMIFPILDNKTQKKISTMAHNALQMNKDASKLLVENKSKIESIITRLHT